MNRKLFMRFTLASVVLLLCTSFFLSAQSTAEVEAAKSMARSYGYSESEINAMVNKQHGGKITQQTNPIPEVARTVTTEEVAASVDTKEIGLTGLSVTPSAIYGHDIFRSPNLNFVPSYNIPTPASYKLAAGDEVVIDIWGAVYQNLTQMISPEGSITIPDLGPVYLTGMTINDAQKALKEQLSRIYSGLGSDNPNTYLRLSLGRIRSFTINVVGDAERPGTYTLPSLSTVFSALYLAGGPTNIGSVRDVKIYRDNKLYKSFDIYDFVVKGDFSANIRLEDNDLIKINPYENLVSIGGKVKRGMTYEIKDDETIADILMYAGGFAKDANSQRVHVVRVNGERTESFDVGFGDFGSFKLQNGDELTVPSNIEDNRNRVTISGPVWYPGNYAISDSVMTLQQLIKVAGGVREEAYKERGYIARLNEKKVKVAVNFSVVDVIAGIEEVMLMNDDSVLLFTNDELVNRTLVYTYGEVNRPDTIEFRPGMTLGDIILLSGGFTVGASQSNIDIARRNYNDGRMSKSDTISTVFNFDLLHHPESLNFELAPYDEIFVRTAPNYKKQQTVSIEGEVLFPGRYVVEKNVVRISDIVKKAGGFNEDAYVEGCVLERQLTDEEYERTLIALQFAKQKTGDTTTFSSADLQRTYSIGIDMKEAVENQGSYSDVILRTGDIIRVPKMNNTVKITGGVLFKNVVAYNPALSVKDYIQQAGGYLKQARKSQTYIVYMNGTLATKRSKGKLQAAPGCEIVVPVKDINENRKLAPSEVMAIATSTASIATMVVTMVNLLK